TKDILESVAMGKGPKLYIVALGCAGWGPGQIESEVKENAWLTSPIDENIVFEMPIEERWEASLKNIGVDPALILNTSGHA
ncbi:MAG TPA: YqgE/AlgH family protein, partial [Desulfobacterales bacterium]|nr:YqgE/AlgH family protein [Desulfobacterales bacterium]